jgi:glycosyltransferase involved in cell wall biosynthesis
MKIAWFTPFSAESAIGRCSEEIIPVLSRVASVDLWHPETTQERPTTVPRMRFRRAEDIDPSSLAQYDLIVYNLGNHWPFHGEIFRVSQMMPGLIVLHDFVMHHFMAAYYFDHLKKPDRYIDAMERLYGKPGRAIAETALSGNGLRIWETNEVANFPMFEEVIRGSYGVIAHSDFLAERLRLVFNGPVCKIPLACELPAEVRGISREELGIPPDRLLILTMGHVNPFKRVHSVLRSMSTLGELREKVFYVVLGPYSKEYYLVLEELVREGQLEDAVRFLGYTSDEAWHAYLQHADLCVNLRFPAFEGASRSMIEGMSYGKAMIVSDTGSYSELPDDTVWKIEPSREATELPKALRELITNPEARSRLGQNALELAKSQYQVSHYVEKFLKFSEVFRQTKPVLEFADRVARTLKDLEVNSTTGAAGSIADRAYDLFWGHG